MKPRDVWPGFAINICIRKSIGTHSVKFNDGSWRTMWNSSAHIRVHSSGKTRRISSHLPAIIGDSKDGSPSSDGFTHWDTRAVSS